MLEQGPKFARGFRPGGASSKAYKQGQVISQATLGGGVALEQTDISIYLALVSLTSLSSFPSQIHTTTFAFDCLLLVFTCK